MLKKKKKPLIDGSRIEDETYEANKEVRQEFDEASRLGIAGHQKLIEKLHQHHSTSPTLSGGDIDAAWEDVDVGEESVGGENPTPDQNIVEKLGEAMGITYEDNEPLHTNEKLELRDKHRWELHPASSEGYTERIKHEGKYEEK